MKIETPTEEDWRFFLDLTKAEGWRVPPNELELYRGPLADGAFVLRRNRRACGFVTAVSHENSGWIGNLIVPSDCRGCGYGSRLLEHTLDLLVHRGMSSFWLTASELGRPLYERRGFRTVGGTERYALKLDQRLLGAASESEGDFENLCRLDSGVWGERRLLPALARGGEVFSCGNTAALLQGGDGMRVLGPWVSDNLCPRENRRVFLAALGSVAAGTEVVIDLLEGSPLSSLLTAAGFHRRGRSDLMVLGSSEGVDMRSLVALASLGSMG